MDNKTVGSKVLLMNELDNYSIQIAFANIPTEYLKLSAQRLREKSDWSGITSNQQLIYDIMMDIIRIVEPKFDTECIPAI